jgi:ribosomal protein L11 methyltransferase
MGNSLSHSHPDRPGWLEIAIDIHPITHEAVNSFLFDLGCDGIVSEDFTQKSIVKAYTPANSDTHAIKSKLDVFLMNLKEIFPEANNFSLIINRIEDLDWNLTWRRFFHTERVTPKLMVIPAWEAIPSETTEYIVQVDPGPAFGTGQHATTRMCLEAMERIGFNVPWTMLDVGTGSGILAVYGAKLGAKRVVGIDIDPDALEWAEKNITLNGLSGAIELSSKPLEKWQGPFSLVTANLTRNTILELFPYLAHMVAPENRLVLSGLLQEQRADIQGPMSNFGFQEEQILFREEWVCLILKKIKGG